MRAVRTGSWLLPAESLEPDPWACGAGGLFLAGRIPEGTFFSEEEEAPSLEGMAEGL